MKTNLIHRLILASLTIASCIGTLGFITLIDYQTQIKNKPTGLFVSVKDPPFLAKGDGSTDDTAAIKAAIASFSGSCGTLFFPRGTYIITPPINFSTCVSVKGEGKGSASIKLNSNLVYVPNYWLWWTLGSNFSVTDLTFDGNSIPIDAGVGTVTTNGTAVTLSSGTSFISNWGDGLLADNSIVINYGYYTIDHVVDSNHLVLTTSAGVQASPVMYAVSGAYYSALAFTECTNYIVSHNNFINMFPTIIVSSWKGGYATYDDNYFQVIAPSINNNEAINISTDNSTPVTDVRITNNTIINTGMDIAVYNSYIGYNYITNWGFGSGITISEMPDVGYNVIEYNVLTNTTGIDINLTRPSGVEDWGLYERIEGNLAYNLSGEGIEGGGMFSLIANNIALNNGTSAPGAGCGIVAMDGASPTSNCSYCTITGNISTDTNFSSYASTPTGTQGFGFCVMVRSPTDSYLNHVVVTDTNNFNQNTENPTNYQMASGIVSTNGTTVNRVSGSMFVTSGPWGSGLIITINGVNYTVNSVVSSTVLTLTSSAGIQTSVPYTIAAYTQTAAVWAAQYPNAPNFQYCVPWNPGAISAGASATVTETVNGAILGMMVSGASYSLNPSGVLFTGQVPSAGSVTFYATNPTSSSITLTGGTLCAMMQYPLNYANY